SGCDTQQSMLGALIAVLGGILDSQGNTFIENTETVLENGTLAFDTWTSVDTPMYRQFWLFDVQNPDDVLNNVNVSNINNACSKVFSCCCHLIVV
uniref:Uncharacterized protein n=1 Tax=Sinocyclocheilus anshuiensis TaxID=1608454 RepID=A0A671R2A5_9TELE